MGRVKSENMNEEKLFHKDFTLVVIGQIISLLGNATIRLALPLYLLDLSGSGALYGTALACSMISMILISPIGGVVADRVNKRNIMVVLDFITAILLIIFLVTVKVANPIVMIMITMMILFGIQAMYQPAVQGSMPLLASGENLLKANGIINGVSALSNLIGPIVGGMLYGFFGIWPVIVVGTGCFAFSAIMEIFIVIPHVKHEKKGSAIEIVVGDFKEGIHFAVRQKPIIMKVSLICALYNLVISSMLMVGMPIVIKINLGLSDQLYGYAAAAMGAGSLIGGIILTVFARKFSVDKVHFLLFGSGLVLVPISMGLVFELNPLVIYGLIILCSAACITLTTIFSIQIITHLQAETPNHLIGKVTSCVMALCMCAQPIGQAIYGILFEHFNAGSGVIILVSTILSMIISLATKNLFINIKLELEYS